MHLNLSKLHTTYIILLVFYSGHNVHNLQILHYTYTCICRYVRHMIVIFIMSLIQNVQTSSVGDDLNQMIYKSRFKSFPTTYDFDLNQCFSHDL